MKNSRFLNITTVSRRLINQFWVEEFRARYGKIRKILLIIALVILFTIVIYSIGGNISTWTFVGAFIELLIVWVFAYGYHPYVLKEREYIRKIYGKHPDLTYYFYDNDMSITTKKSATFLNYSQIEKIVVTKELYVLVVGNRNIFIARDGFMSGNRKAFIKFMEGRINRES